MRNRILLLALTLAAWLGFKIVELLVPGPAILVVLCVVITVMVMHSLWLNSAQRRWRKSGRKHKDIVAVPHDPRVSPEAASWQPWVDIFVAAKNESRVIENCVRNLCNLDYDKFYVWIIDDCSTDDMAQKLELLQQELPRLKVVRRAPGSCPGKSAALNEALPLSKGEVIAVFDADAYVAPHFLKLMLPVLAHEDVGAVQAQKRFYDFGNRFLPRCQDAEYALDTYFQKGRDLIGGAVELRGNGQLVKREALIDVGGWNNKAITDDLDLTMRLLVCNWDIRFIPYAHVWEESVSGLKSLIRQRKRWAEGSIRRYLDYIFPLNSPTRLSFVERLDTLAFFTFFAVPTLIFLEVISELVQLASGGEAHPYFMTSIILMVNLISMCNYFVALRHYRDITAGEALARTIEVNAYTYMLWLPVVFMSVNRILFRNSASPWHRTEHLGQQHQM